MIDLDYRFSAETICDSVRSADDVAARSAAGTLGWDRDYTRVEWLAEIDLDFDALFMPFRIALNGCDLFDDRVLAAAHARGWFEPDPSDRGWLTCAIVPVAVNGVRALLAPAYHDYSGVGLHVGAAPGVRLRFEHRGPDIAVTVRTYEGHWWEGTALGPEQVVPRAALLAAWTGFAARVRRDVLAALPELANHERYGRWFREGEAIIPELWTDEDDEEESGTNKSLTEECGVHKLTKHG